MAKGTGELCDSINFIRDAWNDPDRGPDWFQSNLRRENHDARFLFAEPVQEQFDKAQKRSPLQGNEKSWPNKRIIAKIREEEAQHEARIKALQDELS